MVSFEQVWLQEFAWTKAEKEERIAKRNASMAQQDQPKIVNEPMFCVEEMLKCLYMSLFVYDFPEVISHSQASSEKQANEDNGDVLYGRINFLS